MIAPRTLVGALLALGSCVERGEVISRALGDAAPPSLGRAASVSAGERHACAIIGQQAYCWGANEHGQLGIGSTRAQARPVLVTGDARFVRVRVGSAHSCALDDMGGVHCWGNNDRGQLGLGDREDRLIPTEVALSAPATDVATKFRHGCALLLDTRLYCWGDNEEGQIGQADAYPANDRTAADALGPQQVAAGDWRAVDTADGHTCGVHTSGELWCWGRNSEHELGSDTRVQVREPILVNDALDWLSVSAGQNHTCALKQDRSVWCWGANTASTGEGGSPLGIPGATELDAPTHVGSGSEWAQLDTNTFHTCAIDRSSTLYCWGRNVEGQLGLPEPGLRTEPTYVTSGLVEVSTGRFATCARTDTGAVRCTGENADGQLGTADLERRAEFSPIAISP